MDGTEFLRGLDAARLLRNQRRLEMKELDTPAMSALVSGYHRPPIALEEAAPSPIPAADPPCRG